jgi:hypothetical protein
MSDITINNKEDQDKNQKTTPVTESSDVRNQLGEVTANTILQIWQEFVDNYRTFAAEIECDVKRVRELLDELK